MQETIIYDTSTRCTSTWERLTVLPFHFPVKHSSAYEVGVWNSFLGLLMLLLCQQGWLFFFFFIQILMSILVFLLFPPCRCVVVLFNPRKNKQHHILNSSRWVKFQAVLLSVGDEFQGFYGLNKVGIVAPAKSPLSEDCLGERLPAGSTLAPSNVGCCYWWGNSSETLWPHEEL